MTQQEFEELKDEFNLPRDSHLRHGQYVYVVLWKKYQDIAREINGTKLDPFYDNNNIPDLINYIQEFYVKN